MILHEKTEAEFGFTFEKAPNRIRFYCICDYCGIEFTRDKRTIVDSNKNISKDSCGKGNCKKQKGYESQLKLYGVVNYGGTKESIEKREKTSEDLYGDKNYQKTEECKRKNMEKYGTEHPMQTEEVKEKRKQSYIEHYGSDHHTKSEEYQNERRQRSLDKIGEIHYSKTDEFKNKLKKAFLEKYGVESLFQSEHYQNIMDSKESPRFGKMQAEVKDFLKSLGFEFKLNRTLLNGKEIDLLNQKLGIGVEVNGNFWHHELSPQPRLRSYHFDKYKKCADNNVRLFTIFEDEWKLKNSQCKSILSSALGKYDTKIFARKCISKEVENKEFNEFCEKYHIQGKCNILVCFGLLYENELVGIMSLGRHHRKSDSIVLNRLCFKSGVQIVGGTSRLLSKCVKWCEGKYDKITSWSDNRWSTGNVYQKLGFTLEAELPPDYTYIVAKGGSINRLPKQSCKKSLINCPSDKTEGQFMTESGYARIWDCGKKRWTLSTTQNPNDLKE